MFYHLFLATAMLLYAAAQEVDFDQQLWDASKAVFQDAGGSDREKPFFLCADGKAQILMANCKNWKAEAPQASVCWVCGCNRAQCLANFGLEDTIDGWWDNAPNWSDIDTLQPTAAFRTTGCTGVLRVTICGISGMRDTVAATTGKSAGVIVRNLFQPILDVARI